MDHSKWVSSIRTYLEEASKVKDSYDTAKKGIVEEYEIRKKVLEDVNERFQKTQEAFNRGEATQTALNKLKTDQKLTEEKLNELGKKLDKINKFMEERLEGVKALLSEFKHKIREEINQEKKKLEYQKMKAKYDYLVQSIKAKNDFQEQLIKAEKSFQKTTKQVKKASQALSEQETYLDEISRALGLESVIELQETPQPVSSEAKDDVENIVTKEELSDALQSGRISPELEEKISEAVSQGFI